MRFYIIYSSSSMGKGYLLIGVVVVMTIIPPPPPTPLHFSLSGSFHITDRLNREEKRDITQTQERKKERRRKLASFIDKEHPG